jgi:hypothetical protein
MLDIEMNKVFFITHGAHGGKGGIDKYSKNIIDYFIKYKKLFKLNIISKYIIKLKHKDISKKNSRRFLFFLVILNFFKILKSDVIIVTHINLLPLVLPFIIFKKKIILFSYGMEIWGTKENIIHKLIMKKIEYFICMRKYTMKIQKKKYQLKNKKFFLLHNPIDKIKFIPRINKKKNYIISIGRLTKYEKFKGIDETLEAISLIKNINFKYYIVGEGDDLERLKNKSIKLNLNDKVFFTNYLNDRERDELLKVSKIISMPGSDKIFDTYPYRYTYLESAIFGTHIIASKPHKDELIASKRYKNLNFVNPKNSKEIASMIKKLLSKKNFICENILNDFSSSKFRLDLDKYLRQILKI